MAVPQTDDPEELDFFPGLGSRLKDDVNDWLEKETKKWLNLSNPPLWRFLLQTAPKIDQDSMALFYLLRANYNQRLINEFESGITTTDEDEYIWKTDMEAKNTKTMEKIDDKAGWWENYNLKTKYKNYAEGLPDALGEGFGEIHPPTRTEQADTIAEIAEEREARREAIEIEELEAQFLAQSME